MITTEIAASIDSSVLCWLATTGDDGYPNVTPKEAFLYDAGGTLLVADIASPMTVRNIERDGRVCVSFVNVFVQKGYKIKGNARVVRPDSSDFPERHQRMVSKIGPAFPIRTIIEVVPVAIEPIVAPSYRLFPDSGRLDHIRESLATYRVKEYQKELESSGQSNPRRTESRHGSPRRSP